MDASAPPAKVVRAIITAADAGQWGAVYELVLHAHLPRWRSKLVAVLHHWERAPEGALILKQWGAESAAELEALDERSLFLRWLSATSVEARTRLAFHPQEAPTPAAPRVRRLVLGEVPEGRDLAHVLYRESVGDRGGGALRVVTLHRTEIGWRAEIDYNLLGSHGFHAGPPPTTQSS